MRRQHPTSDTDTGSPWRYRETIDEANSAILVRGHVDRLGVDLLRGAIEELSRRGHRHITVTLEEPGTVDPYSRAVLAEVADALEGCGGRLTIRRSTDQEDGDPALVVGSGHESENGRRRHIGGDAGRYRRAAG